MPPESILIKMVAMRGREVFWGWKQLSILPLPDLVPRRQMAAFIMKSLGIFQANDNICAAYIKSLCILEVRTA